MSYINNPYVEGLNLKSAQITNDCNDAAVDVQEISEHIEPQPLFKDMPPAALFPMDALGSVGASAARSIQQIVKAPDAICGQSILAGLAVLAQPHADISIDGRVSPTSELFATTGSTGERKSGVDNVATWPHKQHERKLEEDYKSDNADYVIECDLYRLEREQGLKKAKTPGDRRRHLEEMGNPPVEPAQPVLLIEEPTYEGLIKVLQYGRPSVGLFTDEGGRFIGGHAMNSENALKTAAGISGLWDRGSAKRTRSADGHSAIYGKRVSMHLMMQGVVADMLIGNAMFREQGLLSRMLISWPDSTVGNRPYVEENIFDDPAIKAYHQGCFSMLERDLPMNENLELKPPVFELSSDAKRIWVPFHDYCDKHAGAGKELESVRGLANKAPEHSARLAGILSVIKGASVISSEDIESGIELMNYYLNEAIRMSDSVYLNQEIKDAALLMDWFREKKYKHIYPATIYQYAPIRRLRTKKTAMTVIGLLEEHGRLIRRNPVEIDGKRRRDVWEVVYV